jgi:GTPase SAR1 family protein
MFPVFYTMITKAFRIQRVPMVVVGTKLDLFNEREVLPDKMQSLSDEWGIPFHKTSAKRNWHVTEVFEDLLRQMRRHYPTDPLKKRKKLSSLLACMIM